MRLLQIYAQQLNYSPKKLSTIQIFSTFKRTLSNIIIIYLMSSLLTIKAEQCLSIWAMVRWNGFTVSSMTLSLPLVTEGPRSFVGGEGFDYYARFETEMNTSGKVILKTHYKGLVDNCSKALNMSNTLSDGKYINIGTISCGENQYNLELRINGVIDQPIGCG